MDSICSDNEVISTNSTPSLCPSEESYGEYEEETELFRHFRDEVLNKTEAGKELIKLYYQLSLALVRALERNTAFRKEVRAILDVLVTTIRKEIQ